MDFNDDPVLAEQEQQLMEKMNGKKAKTAKVQREGQKFDSGKHEKEKQKEKQEMAKEMTKENR